jgi:RHS repeat-associated protein
VRDHFGNLVLDYVYTNGLLTEIRDNPALIPGNTAPARSVRYHYAGTLIDQVTDVRGYVTLYTYGNGQLASLTDPEGRVRRFEYLGDRVAKEIDAEGHETRYVYDYDKLKKQFYVRLTHPATAAGARITEHWYDTDGILIRRDVNGQTEYQKGPLDTATRRQSETDAAGRKTEIVKDEFDHIVQTTYPDGATTRARYSAVHGQVLEETDELGVKTQYEYDALGNLLRKIEAAGLPEPRVTEYAVDAYGQVTRETRKGGRFTLPDGHSYDQDDASVSYQYDDRGNRIQVTDALGHVTRYDYDLQGNVIRLIDANDQVWQATYDAQGHLLSRRDPLGHTTRMEYDQVGNLVRQTDPLGNATVFGYDKQNRPVTVQDALGYTRTRQYDTLGRLTADLDELGKVRQRLNYDGKGRMVQSDDALGNSTRYVYDDSVEPNAPLEITYPSYTRRFRYDARGRAVEIRDSSDISVNGASQSVSYTRYSRYDSKGQEIETTDRLGHKTQMAYDALGRLVQTTDAQGGVTRFAYDIRDNILAVADAHGNTTRYEYDASGRRIKEIRPLGETTQYQYDALGNLVQVTDAKGNAIAYRYDAADRRVEETHTLAGGTSPSRTIAYAYNDAGTLTGYTDDNRSHADHLSYSASYTLDALQRRLQERITLGSQTVTLATSYHPTGRKASQTWPDGSTVGYTYDDAQLLKDIQFPAENGHSASLLSIRQRSGNTPTDILYPGGSTRSQTLDGFQRLTEFRVKTPGQVELMRYQYQHDAENNIIQKDTEHGAYRYQYDELYRLTAGDNPEGLPDEAYGYDKLGNRIQDARRPNPNQSDDAWQYNTNNQLTESATENTGFFLNNSLPVTHVYDENGSLIRKSTPAGTEVEHPYENQQFVYDAQNRLIEVQDSDGNPIASYQYDPEGRRVRKTVHRQWNGGGWESLAQVITTTYFYNEEGLVAEYQAQGDNAVQLQAQYGWRPEGTWGTDPVWIKTTPAGGNQTDYFYYQNDHLGTPQKIIDRYGQSVWSQKAMSFGETTIDPASMVISNLRFPGQVEDAETGWYYNWYRYYESSIGQYVVRDPIGPVLYKDMATYSLLSSIGQSNVGRALRTYGGRPKYNHLYGYVFGNPNSRIDPFGLLDDQTIDFDPLPDLTPCYYYDYRCAQTGCRYYCYTAPFICRNAANLPVFIGISAGQFNCIRSCLVREDAKEHAKKPKQCTGNDCLPDKVIDDYHKRCFPECGVPSWRYPGVNPPWLPINPNKPNN